MYVELHIAEMKISKSLALQMYAKVLDTKVIKINFFFCSKKVRSILVHINIGNLDQHIKITIS